MAEYISVDEARKMSGLRVVLSPGVPGPWSESAKGILHVKKIPYVRVAQEIGGANTELIEWSAQATAPVAVWNDEPPRSTWIEQLYLVTTSFLSALSKPCGTGPRAKSGEKEGQFRTKKSPKRCVERP